MTAAAYEKYKAEGMAISGALEDMPQRAMVHHQLYRDSGKRNVFPLIAAHGALWGHPHMQRGLLGAKVLALVYLLQPALRRQKLDSVARFADRIREINRSVCVHAYAVHHYTREYGATAAIRAVIGDDFAELMVACHQSARLGTDFPRAMRERLFGAFLAWEQAYIVAPSLAEAFADLDWEFVAKRALRPIAGFSYLPKNAPLRFKNFASKDERIAGGLKAYRSAEDLGLDQVEAALARYGSMPRVAQLDAGYEGSQESQGSQGSRGSQESQGSQIGSVTALPA